ncbi:hypothetical protein Q9S36_33280 [Microbacterium sp. ARD31]|jgi:hypothetical protein|uniref:hypothetical protein n=1 Tax=unclassified Microbacterium TaxID=2609290 RepID=UPI00203EC939|nr:MULTISPECIES: hypothetical protein [unclassified Microbacterium]MDT0185065.1 hypothetical protein [Microbacterium sp. ARD31]
MARTGGRSTWIAVPAILACFAVVGVLGWLAMPMFPVAAAWVGDSLRGASERAAQAPEPPASQILDLDAVDCRGLYPDALWSELTWTSGVILRQDRGVPETAAGSVAEALAPQVRVTCRWTREQPGSIVTTLASVDPAVTPIAEAALGSQGFACESSSVALTCTREQGRVREEHTLIDGLWLSSVETRWMPEDYGARLDAHIFG